MRRRITSLIVSLLLPCTLEASDAFLLRDNGPQQGIVRFDSGTKTETSFASFVYRSHQRTGPWGSLALTATSDRIIAQGSAFYDFEIATGRLLRRYPAHAPEYSGWAFRGVAIDESLANRLGMKPGYYGVPVCPPGFDPTGYLCAPPAISFPGYKERTNVVENHILLRRGLAPDNTALEIARTTAEHPVDWSSINRFIALDEPEARLLFFLQGYTVETHEFLETITAAALSAAGVGEEVTLHHQRYDWLPSPDPAIELMISTTYEPSTHSLLSIFAARDAAYKRLIRRDVTTGTMTELLRVPDGQDLASVTTRPAATPTIYAQVIPIVGETAGANDTFWRSDVWLFNPAGEAIVVTIRRSSEPERARRITMNAHAGVKFNNALHELGGGARGDGMAFDGLIIESPYREGAQLSAYSRTYTTATGGGTYGQGVPAVPSLVGYSNHLAITTVALDMAETNAEFVLDKRDPARFRNNIGVTNTSDRDVTVRLRYAWPAYEYVPADRERVFTVPARSVRQFTIEALFSDSVTTRLGPRIWVTADHPAIIWLSTVDNQTGDASYLPFTLYDLESDPSGTHTIPMIGRLPGANGTSWQTDAYGVFASVLDSAPVQQPLVTFHPGDGKCSERQFRLAGVAALPVVEGEAMHPYWRTTFLDLARQACDSEGTIRGALEVKTGSWMSFVTRTYTTREDGGTYGDILPLYPSRGWPVRHFAGIEMSAAARVNIGLYNGQDAASIIDLTLYAADGTVAGNRAVSITPRGGIQPSLAELFPGLPTGLYGLSVKAREGGVWPYVSTIDNVTGDPTNWW